jgi:isopenicillin-N N-acyltransferase-like protein
MRGIAQGADLDLDDVLALNIRSEISLTNYSDGCTSIAKVDGQSVLIAQNWDWVEEAGDVTVLLDIRAPDKPRILMSGEAGIVGKFGMNDAGVGVCMNAIKCGVLDAGKLPVHVAMRLVLESSSFDAARAKVDALGLASCVNFVIADKAGNFATVECTPKGNAVIAPEAGSGTVCHTNHIYSPDNPAGIKDFPSENSFSRLARIRELSDGKPGSVDSIREWLSDEEGAPAAICRSRPPTARGIERMVTLATVIIDLKKLEMQVSYGKPNQNPPVKTLVF